MVHPGQTADGNFPSIVRVGGWDKAKLLKALRGCKIQLNQAAEDLFNDSRFKPCTLAKEIRISATSVSELGFPEGATYEQLAARAQEVGLKECPLELGAYLRLQFLNQPDVPAEHPASKGRAPFGAITIASAPLDHADETPKGFYLRRIAGTFWLRGYWSGPDHICNPEDVWVFSRGEKAVYS
ncbi:MAG: helicase [Planctomycetes bacterium]|nr:helicase [Planctomycetota bacterium]